MTATISAGSPSDRETSKPIEFQRVAIVNRGEAAVRFIHAIREYNQEYGTSLRTIALFTEPENHAMFVREADEAVALGRTDPMVSAGSPLKPGYRDVAQLERALRAARADAVWPGWGFIAEHADIADLCAALGIVFIGPSADVMRRLEDKTAAGRLAEEAGIPVLPSREGSVVTPAETRRHVEVQIIADRYGTTWAPGLRDCAMDRRQRKILAEAPSPVLTPEQDAFLRESAIRFSQTAGFTGAGAVEFLYQPENGRFAFLAMNTSLAAEHPATECTTGLDLVKLEIHVARGGRLEGEPPRTVGHAIEACLNAEDPENAFARSPGVLERFRIPSGPGIRIDTGVSVGDAISPDFDPLIAKVTAFGRNRKEAFYRLDRALRESVVVVKGGASNKSFLLEMLHEAEVQAGGDNERKEPATNSKPMPRPYAALALLEASIEAYQADLAVELTQFYASAVRLRPQVQSGAGRSIELRYRGLPYALQVSCLGPQLYRVEVDGASLDVHVDCLGQFEYWLTGFGPRVHVVSVPQGLSYRIEVEGVSHRVDRYDGWVHAASPAIVVHVAVEPGDVVASGDVLAVVEAMKMEMRVLAPSSGMVRKVLASPHMHVVTGSPLIQLEPLAAGQTAAPEERVDFRAAMAAQGNPAPARFECPDLEQIRRLVLGFDVDPGRMPDLLSGWRSYCQRESQCGYLKEAEEEILNIFVDICSLFSHQPVADDTMGGEAPSAEAYLFSYLRAIETAGDGLPVTFVDSLRRALAHYGVHTLNRSPQLEESLLRIYKSHRQAEQQVPALAALLERRLELFERDAAQMSEPFRLLLDRLVFVSRGAFPALSDLAREVRYRYFDQPLFDQARRRIYAGVEDTLRYLAGAPDAADRSRRVRELLECPQPLEGLFSQRFPGADAALRRLMLEVLTARHYRIRTLMNLGSEEVSGQCVVSAEYEQGGKRIHVFTAHLAFEALTLGARAILPLIEKVPPEHDVVIDFYTWRSSQPDAPDRAAEEIGNLLSATAFPRAIRRIVVAVAGPDHGPSAGAMQHFTYRPSEGVYREQTLYRGLHPMMGKRLELWRFKNFKTERLPSAEDVYLFHAVALENSKDERLLACVEVRDLTPARDEAGRIVQLPHLERMFTEALAAIRLFQSRRPPQARLHWNRVLLYVWPQLVIEPQEMQGLVRKLAPATEGLGLEQVAVRARVPHPETGELRDMILRISIPAGFEPLITLRPVEEQHAIKPLTEYTQNVVRMRRRGLLYPYEIVKMLAPSAEDAPGEFPPGEFVEYDLGETGELIPVDRPYGENKANIVSGVIRNFTKQYREGMTRVVLLGDPSKDLGALSEPECRRIIAALELAEQMRVPLEWFALSAGARISMTSGVENMDWIARVLRKLVEFTQAGGEVNVIIHGINVGAQPYWNAEATMLMHTKGILVMTPQAAMVLTGKHALDYSGGISAEDNQGIGGYDRIMGPNGQAQYWARDMDEACHILLRHYEHAYVAPGEQFPRRAATTDPIDRDIRSYPHNQNDADGFRSVGEIFSDETNRGRKKSFDIRKVMLAVRDQDHAPLERWAGMRAAETAVVWDAHLGGYPVCLIGIESRPVPRLGFIPADGPHEWNAGTLFPFSSKKIARAINSASGNRPVVLLANLSGFDGSPESLRKLQLEYGAEIGRAVVNFKGPLVFCVVSRYHGGAYVVFSRSLNENLEVAALEGTYASVIGGAPAAAVVFAGEVDARTRRDARLQALDRALDRAEGAGKDQLRAKRSEMFKLVHSEKLGEVADEFDRIHSVHRALEVGALDHILPSANLRPYLIGAVERGILRALNSSSARLNEEAGICAKAATSK